MNLESSEIYNTDKTNNLVEILYLSKKHEERIN